MVREFFLLSVFVYLGKFLLECKGEGYPAAPNCARLECPSYDVIHSESTYEIRSYKDALWVSSPKIVSKSYEEGADESFTPLYDYINGNNNQHVRINMTAPLLTDIENSSYTANFYLPKKYQNAVTTPTSSQIKTVKLPTHKYSAVRRFPGYITEKNLPVEVSYLKKSLQGTPYQRAASLDAFTVALYNTPYGLRNRVNEVILWFD